LQINSRWHFQAGGWPSIAAMIYPANKSRYAAFFLADLRWQHGTWTDAVARYHSGANAALQNRYLCAVLREDGAADPACAAGQMAQATMTSGDQR
jgi:hypothetical protein